MRRRKVTRLGTMHCSPSGLYGCIDEPFVHLVCTFVDVVVLVVLVCHAGVVSPGPGCDTCVGLAERVALDEAKLNSFIC